MSYDIAGTLAKPAKPPSGAKALLIETQPSEDVKPLALERGLAVLTLDVAKLPDKAERRPCAMSSAIFAARSR